MEQLSRRAAVHHADDPPVGDEEAAFAAADPHAGGASGGHTHQTSGTHHTASAKRGTSSARGNSLVARVLLCMNSSRRNQILWGVSIGVLVLTALYFLYISSLDQRAVVLDVMQCTHDVLVEHGIPYFLDYGSLLGATRHKGFIPWDDTNDIDIGVFASDTDRIYALGPLLSQLCGYHMIHRSDVAYLPGVTAFVIKRGAFRIYHNRVTPIYVDVADYETMESTASEEKDPIITDKHYPELNLRYPRSKLLPTVDCEFEGRTFLCPQDSDFVLTQLYGKDWRTPKKDFKPFMVDHTSSSTDAQAATAR